MEDRRKLICVYDAERLRHEREENRRFVVLDSRNTRKYYHYACDSLVCVTHVIAGNEFDSEESNNNINSIIMCRYEYDTFRNAINEEEKIINRYGFTWEIHVSITDMYFLRARYYVPNKFSYTYYVEIDVTDLEVIQGRDGVFVIPNESPLDLVGRIVSNGKVVKN